MIRATSILNVKTETRNRTSQERCIFLYTVNIGKLNLPGSFPVGGEIWLMILTQSLAKRTSIMAQNVFVDSRDRKS